MLIRQGGPFAYTITHYQLRIKAQKSYGIDDTQNIVGSVRKKEETFLGVF